MITFQIEEKEYILPDFLSIENYVKVYKVKDLLDDNYYQAKLIQTITGADLSDVLDTSHHQINFITNHLTQLFPDTKYPFIDKFVLNGVEYGFIPSWKNMSFAEFVDLDTLLTKTPFDIMNNLHIICAIMYRPIIFKKSEHNFQIEKYNADTVEERANLFLKELDVKYVLGGQFFFSRFAEQSLQPSQQYSMWMKMKIWWRIQVTTWKMRKIIWKLLLNKPLDGSQLLIDYAQTTLQNTIWSSQKGSLNVSTNSSTFWKKIKKWLKDLKRPKVTSK